MSSANKSSTSTEFAKKSIQIFEEYHRAKKSQEEILDREIERARQIDVEYEARLAHLYEMATQPLGPLFDATSTNNNDLNLSIQEDGLFNQLATMKKRTHRLNYLVDNAYKIFQEAPRGVDYVKVIMKSEDGNLNSFERKRPSYSAMISNLVTSGALIKFKIINTSNDFRFLRPEALEKDSFEREAGWLSNLEVMDSDSE